MAGKAVKEKKQEELELEDESSSTVEGEETSDELDKSLDIALSKLEKTVSSKNSEDEDEEEDQEEEELAKKKKKKVEKSKKIAEIRKGMDDDEDDDDEPDFEALSKSLPAAVEEDEAAAEVLDAVPFVKALINKLEEQFSALVKAVILNSERLSNIEEGQKKSQELEVALAKLTKSISKNLKIAGDQPQPRKSVLGKSFTIVRKEASGGEERNVTLSKSQALEKLGVLCREGKIDLVTLTKAEARIQKGMELPESVNSLLVGKEE